MHGREPENGQRERGQEKGPSTRVGNFSVVFRAFVPAFTQLGGCEWQLRAEHRAPHWTHSRSKIEAVLYSWRLHSVGKMGDGKILQIGDRPQDGKRNVIAS